MIDGKAEKYFRYSPYVYAINNPVRFLDPDGNQIVDAKGNVIYTQSGGWTKGASQDAQRISTAMLRTETGRNQWNAMVSSDHKINLSINTTVSEGNIGGMTAIPKTKDPETGMDKLKPDGIFKVEIYEKVIERTTNEKGTVNTGLELDQAIAATAGHESVHATNEQNEKDAIENKYLPEGSKHDIEKQPNAVGNKIREEARNELKPLEPKKPILTVN